MRAGRVWCAAAVGSGGQGSAAGGCGHRAGARRVHAARVQRGWVLSAARVTKHEGHPLGARAQRRGKRRRRCAEQRAEWRGRALGALLRRRRRWRPLVEPGAGIVERVGVGDCLRQEHARARRAAQQQQCRLGCLHDIRDRVSHLLRGRLRGGRQTWKVVANTTDAPTRRAGVRRRGNGRWGGEGVPCRVRGARAAAQARRGCGVARRRRRRSAARTAAQRRARRRRHAHA